MKRALLPVSLVVAIIFVVAATIRDARQTAAAASAPVGSAALTTSTGTSRAQLSRTVEDMTARIASAPRDARAVVRLADALIRLQRVNNDGRAVIAAEQYLRTFLKNDPRHYEAQRMLAAVLLSQHRFGEAIAQANRLSAMDPRDPWNYGLIGDGYFELGDYERAFAAYDRMGQLQPGPPAYARTSHGLEIKGDLDGALEFMQRAADGSWANDPESQAWHYAQLGELLLQRGRLGDAKRQFEHAAATFADQPLAMAGLAKVKVAQGDLNGARLSYQAQLARVPTPDLAAIVGDLSAVLGDASGAEQYYRMAEQIERAGWGNGVAQPQALAKFFAERDRNVAAAVTLAEEAIKSRKDIFTYDTLAWAYFKSGRLAEARIAATQARRTGTADARILYHTAEILAASGDPGAALAVLTQIRAPDAIADVLIAGGVRALRARLPAAPASRS
ncbi:MAG TPA: tetratricopeptide repeat protein [Vicinamibacterales bacterium]|nr:tetratricopeptide repeat protein [Vicinamibacterales bacterium]